MELLIKSLNHQGLGVAQLEGKTVFVSNALPGERVLAVRKEQHRRYDVAQAVEILEPAPERIAPICPHFQVCGGCALQHMDATAQLALKQQTLLEQLQHFAKATPKTVLPPLQGPTQAYRRKARLGVKFVNKKDKLLIGFREQNNRYLADLNTCKVLVPKVGESFEPLRDMIMQLSNYRSIPQIEVSAGDEIVALIVRHLEPLTAEDLIVLRNYGQAHNFHIYLQPKGPDTVHLLWPENTEPKLYYRLAPLLRQQSGTSRHCEERSDAAISHYEDEAITLEFNPLDFTQVNANINQQMVALALQQLDLQPSDKVLDLFCGLGNFTLPMAKQASSVVGVEGCAQMVKQLLANATVNQLDNVQGYAFDLTQPLEYQPWIGTYDKILLDPPRAGAEAVAAQINRFKAQKIVYISCHLATLARDTQIILAQGYQLQAAGVIDMFPHTMHAESIAVFEKK